MVVPPTSSKVALRAAALAIRRNFARALPPDVRAALEEQLMRRVLPHLGLATVVAAYHPMRDEIDPSPILQAIASSGRVGALPWFAGRDARMIFRQVPAAETGPWGVLQPLPTAAAVRPEVVLVPLVAADVAGNRIGHGKGHYDRALAHMREAGAVRTIGVAWDVQVLDETIPADAWDVPLDAIATPGRWIEGTLA